LREHYEAVKDYMKVNGHNTWYGETYDVLINNFHFRVSRLCLSHFLNCNGEIRDYPPFITLAQVKARVDAWTNHSYICHDKKLENRFVKQKQSNIPIELDTHVMYKGVGLKDALRQSFTNNLKFRRNEARYGHHPVEDALGSALLVLNKWKPITTDRKEIIMKAIARIKNKISNRNYNVENVVSNIDCYSIPHVSSLLAPINVSHDFHIFMFLVGLLLWTQHSKLSYQNYLEYTKCVL
jgi:hypothetical protein